MAAAAIPISGGASPRCWAILAGDVAGALLIVRFGLGVPLGLAGIAVLLATLPRARRVAGGLTVRRAALALGLLGAGPAFAADPPERPSILSNRWQEDWSPLADRRCAPSRSMPSNISRWAMGRAGSPSAAAGAAGSRRTMPPVRLRAGAGGQLVHQPAGGACRSARRPGAALRPAPERLRRASGSRGRPTATGSILSKASRPSSSRSAGTVKLRIGRQQFAFDLQRFVSVRDGPNVRQSFDAVWGDYEIGRWRFIGYYTQPVETRDGHAFDDRSSRHNRFYGARIERQVLGTNELSAYWSRYTDDAADGGPERRDVWDMRFAGKKVAIDWDMEAMFQHGHVGPMKARGWAVAGRLGYTLAETSWKPRLGLQFDAASGDDDPEDRTLGTFNLLFPNGAYLNLAGYSAYANFIHVKPSLTVAPGGGVTLMTALAAEWRATRAGCGLCPAEQSRAGHGRRRSRWIGAYGQLRADWKTPVPGLTAALEGVHFRAGDTIRPRWRRRQRSSGRRGEIWLVTPSSNT